MIETMLSVLIGILIMAAIVGLSLLVVWGCTREPCLHTFEKIAENEKHIILVCERCGKVKKVRM